LTSEATARANAFVEEHLPQARALGVALAELTEEPESFVATLTDGLRSLEDPAYGAEQERVAPGSGPTLGVRWPLIRAIERPVRAALEEGSSASALWLAQRLATAAHREVRLFALPALRRSLGDDPERSWQLLRRMARASRDWISIDSLADVFARGILQEPFRWAEIEQLVYSPQRMERRLVGSTLATLPHRLPHGAPRSEAIERWAPRCLDLERQLMGDADDQVRKALGWAIREWSKVAPAPTEAFLRSETDIAVHTADGNRAWVIRDGLQHVAPALAIELRTRLATLRRRPTDVSTSPASQASAAFLNPLPAAQLADQAIAMQGDRFARRGA
jgi:3-methyladenine DNA glycosylase AlkD